MTIGPGSANSLRSAAAGGVVGRGVSGIGRKTIP
jgi:hypothetical protein